MILTIDIGNTTIGLGVVHKGRVLAVDRLETGMRFLISGLQKKLQGFDQKGYEFEEVVICSVVPKAAVIVERFISKSLRLDAHVVGRDIIVPIKNRYKNPKQVGQDRLVGAYAASKLYGTPVIVIDLGTAITFDVVSKKGDYLGGVIVPGLRLSAESLFLKTALLPQIDIKAPQSVIGRSTQDSILSGLFYGFGALCQGMIESLSKHTGAPAGKTHVVMTGGHTALMKKFISSKIRIIDDSLVHKGMALLLSDA